MDNPWLEIPGSDYEHHMHEVGQAQLLNRLTRRYLHKFSPEIFVLAGCATGNGLEHVDNHVTKKIIAIDINPDYLQMVHKRFADKLNNLQILQLDIEKDDFTFDAVELFFAGLILEYVDQALVITKMSQSLSSDGKLVVVIQKSLASDFVTPTKYESLKRLADISHEVDELQLIESATRNGLFALEREEFPLSDKKSFVCFCFGKL